MKVSFEEFVSLQIKFPAGRHCEFHQIGIVCKISLQGFKWFINFLKLSLI
jgi:hypothetical protein